MTWACSRMASTRPSRPVFWVAELDRLSVAAQALDDDLMLEQFVDDPGRIGLRLIDLVDGGR